MSRTYVGRCNRDRKWVDVVVEGTVTPLTNRGRPWGGEFAWGGQAAGSVALARSILWDVLGGASSEVVAVMFAGDILSQLPEEAFALSEGEVRNWLEERRQPRMSARELVEHLGTIALAEPEEETEVLRGLVDRCWRGRALVN